LLLAHNVFIGSVPFAIDHIHNSWCFSLFKHCEWLMVNCNIGKRAPLVFIISTALCFVTMSCFYY